MHTFRKASRLVEMSDSSDDVRRISVSVDSATLAVLDDVARTFYGGVGHGSPGRGKALASAVRAWAIIVRDPATHGLATKPVEALSRWREYGQRELPGLEVE